MKTDPVNTPAAQSPGPNPNPMETTRDRDAENHVREAERVDVERESETPPAQTWKNPDDGKSLSEKDQELPVKP